MTDLIGIFLRWYLIIQLVTLAALPLATRVFADLPDRGYAFAKSLGILLVSVVLWLGVSYGVLRNDGGGAWLALLIVAGISWTVGRSLPARFLKSSRSAVPWRSILIMETLFLLAFAAWAYVRIHDPAADHTEQPMDLMFMNAIWNSAAYPPRDAWLSGYAISYYYLGYWMLTTLGRLADLPPAVAYNVGQASWFGLLLLGSFGVVFNLLLRERGRSAQMPSLQAVLGGLLGAVAVGATGNLQSLLEWLYANGVKLEALNRWIDVYNFPENAEVTNLWFINRGWWWWRSSRVIEDLDLNGNHIEVIDEFPSFSYVLGDNHPHVLAMPFVLLVIGLALTIFWSRPSVNGVSFRQRLPALLPLGWGGLVLLSVAAGALIFLNTWDFPPYWLLLMLATFVAAWRTRPEGYGSRIGQAALAAVVVGGAMLLGLLVVYLPYFLTAQSQAGGFLPNLFHPTRLPQFLVMFGAQLLALLVLLLLAWRAGRPTLAGLGLSGAIVIGLPVLFLAGSAWIATNTEAGAALLNRLALPEGASAHLPFIIERWTTQPFTFLLLGVLLSVLLALMGRRLATGYALDSGLVFALLLAGIGLLLVFAPEFIYLRDNFGTRMNTIFKFYYQAWLLFGLSGAFALATALGSRSGQSAWWIRLPAAAALVLILTGLIFPVAGAYSKTDGFSNPQPTFDATAYLQVSSPGEAAAVAWLQTNAHAGANIAEAIGASYRANTSRISTMTGRPTLLGWPGHESQWRGDAYGVMAQGRAEALEQLYRTGSPAEITQLLDRWHIDYVIVGPAERAQYGINSETESRFIPALELVFEAGDVRIYRRRG